MIQMLLTRVAAYCIHWPARVCIFETSSWLQAVSQLRVYIVHFCFRLGTPWAVPNDRCPGSSQGSVDLQAAILLLIGATATNYCAKVFW